MPRQDIHISYRKPGEPRQPDRRRKKKTARETDRTGRFVKLPRPRRRVVRTGTADRKETDRKRESPIFKFLREREDTKKKQTALEEKQSKTESDKIQDNANDARKKEMEKGRQGKGTPKTTHIKIKDESERKDTHKTKIEMRLKRKSGAQRRKEKKRMIRKGEERDKRDKEKKEEEEKRKEHERLRVEHEKKEEQRSETRCRLEAARKRAQDESKIKMTMRQKIEDLERRLEQEYQNWGKETQQHARTEKKLNEETQMHENTKKRLEETQAKLQETQRQIEDERRQKDRRRKEEQAAVWEQRKGARVEQEEAAPGSAPSAVSRVSAIRMKEPDDYYDETSRKLDLLLARQQEQQKGKGKSSSSKGQSGKGKQQRQVPLRRGMSGSYYGR